MIFRRAFQAMGGEIGVWLNRAESPEAEFDRARSVVQDCERELSRFDNFSTLSELNRRLNELVSVSGTLFSILLAARTAAELTGGLYNPLILDALEYAGYDRSFEGIERLQDRGEMSSRVLARERVGDWRRIRFMFPDMVSIPARVDLGGIVKGWLANALANELSQFGPTLINICGDLAARGRTGDGRGWLVRLHIGGGALEVLNQAVATSGIGKRRWMVGQRLMHHIVDPATGRCSSSDLEAVTVVHNCGVLAEAFAKAIFLSGREAGLALANTKKLAALLATKAGTVIESDQFRGLLRR